MRLQALSLLLGFVTREVATAGVFAVGSERSLTEADLIHVEETNSSNKT